VNTSTLNQVNDLLKEALKLMPIKATDVHPGDTEEEMAECRKAAGQLDCLVSKIYKQTDRVCYEIGGLLSEV
jgi:hypothetical protein